MTDSHTICPKCGYQAVGLDDPLLTKHDGLGECPRCGVIPRKYARSAAVQSNSEVQAATEFKVTASSEIQHSPSDDQGILKIVAAVVAASIAMLIPWCLVATPLFGGDALIERIHPSLKGLFFFMNISISAETWRATYERISGCQVKHRLITPTIAMVVVMGLPLLIFKILNGPESGTGQDAEEVEVVVESNRIAVDTKAVVDKRALCAAAKGELRMRRRDYSSDEGAFLAAKEFWLNATCEPSYGYPREAFMEADRLSLSCRCASVAGIYSEDSGQVTKDINVELRRDRRSPTMMRVVAVSEDRPTANVRADKLMQDVVADRE